MPPLPASGIASRTETRPQITCQETDIYRQLTGDDNYWTPNVHLKSRVIQRHRHTTPFSLLEKLKFSGPRFQIRWGCPQQGLTLLALLL